MKEALRNLAAVDRRCALALVYTALMCTIQEYALVPPRVEARLQGLPSGTFAAPSLEAGLTWAFGVVATNLVVPLLIVLLVHRERPSSIGYRWGGFARHVGVYLALYGLVMVPILLWVAQRQDFLQAYPFVSEATRSWRVFLIWEAAYLLQFLALESFFRGYLLFTLERRIGWMAVFVMTVPYCMIHYHKPPLEALAAILAGLALGALALRYRSFFGGVLLHGLVALTMDLLSAHRAGLF